MIKAVLFDFYGVLYPDTFWGLANEFLEHRSEEVQQAMHDLVRRADLSQIDQKTFWTEAAKIFGVPLEVVEKERDAYGGVDKKLLSRIRALKEKGLSIGVISNVGSGTIESVLGDDISLFSVMVLSGDTGFVKPDSQVYELALERLGLSAEECLFVDDIPRNVRGAEAVGMHAVQYNGVQDYDRAIKRLVPDMNDQTLV